MIRNINPYNRDKFEQSFRLTEIYKKLEQDFGKNNLIWEKFFYNGGPTRLEDAEGTPRAQYKNFSMSVFYYLLQLLDNDYNLIYDLGCGKNMFKPYLPRLIGIDIDQSTSKYTIAGYNNIKDTSWPTISSIEDFKNLPRWIRKECSQKKLDVLNYKHKHFYGDVDGMVDYNYVSGHQNYFESVFSICALHFHPLSMFKKIVLDFVSMVKPGGRGFLSLNLQRMIERETNLSQLFSTDTPTTSQYDDYLRTELSTLSLTFLILDIDLELINDSMDGNIRLVIEK